MDFPSLRQHYESIGPIQKGIYMDNTKCIGYANIFYALPAVSDFLSMCDWKQLRRTCSFFYLHSLDEAVACRMSFLYQYSEKHRNQYLGLSGFLSSIPELTHFRGAKVKLNLRHVTGRSPNMSLPPLKSSSYSKGSYYQLQPHKKTRGLRLPIATIPTSSNLRTEVDNQSNYNYNTVFSSECKIELPSNLTDLLIEDSHLFCYTLDLSHINELQTVSFFECTLPSVIIWNKNVKQLQINSCKVNRRSNIPSNGSFASIGMNDDNYAMEETTSNITTLTNTSTAMELNLYDIEGIESLELVEVQIGFQERELHLDNEVDPADEVGTLVLRTSSRYYFPNNLRHLDLRNAKIDASTFDLSNLTMMKSLDFYKVTIRESCCVVLPKTIEEVTIESSNASGLIQQLGGCHYLKRLRIVDHSITDTSDNFISNSVEDLALVNCRYIGQLLCFHTSNIKSFLLGGLNTRHNHIRINAGPSLKTLKVTNSKLTGLSLNLTEASNLVDIDLFNVTADFDKLLPANIQRIKLDKCRFNDGMGSEMQRVQLPILTSVVLVSTDPQIILGKYIDTSSLERLHLEKCDMISLQEYPDSYKSLTSLSLVEVKLPDCEDNRNPLLLPTTVNNLDIKGCIFQDQHIHDIGHFLRYFDFADIDEMKDSNGI